MADITPTNVNPLSPSSGETKPPIQPSNLVQPREEPKPPQITSSETKPLPELSHLPSTSEEFADKADTESNASEDRESVFSNSSETSSTDDAPLAPPSNQILLAAYLAHRVNQVQEINNSFDMIEADLAELERNLVTWDKMFKVMAVAAFFAGVGAGLLGGYFIWG